MVLNFLPDRKVESARKIGLATFYNAVSAPRGFGLAPHHFPIIAGLEDDRIRNFLYLAPPGTGKSNLLCSILPAYWLGEDPTTTILSVSAGEKLPQSFMSATMQIIQHDQTFKQLFPEVRPAPELGWSLGRGIFVSGHHPSDADASYISVGLTSKALTGLHARKHIYDDLHDRENSSSPEGRAGVKNVYYDTLLGRADPRGCRRVAAGRWWAKDDLYQEWIQSGDWVVLQLPATRSGAVQLYYDVFVPRNMDCVYSETLEPEPVQDDNSLYDRYRAYYAAVDTTRRGFYWPASPSKRQEYEVVKRRQPRTAAVNYDGDMTGGDEAIFRDTDFVPYFPPEGLHFGVAAQSVSTWIKGLRGDIEQAWDTALGQLRSESATVSLTGVFAPCRQWHRDEDLLLVGPCDFHFDVYLLWCNVKSVDFRELAMMLRSEYGMWHPSMVTVEEKQSGVSLLQTFKGSHIPLRGQKVEEGKIARAVNPVMDSGEPIPGGAASVQGWGRMGRIRVPMGAPWLDRRDDNSPPGSGFLNRVLGYAGGRASSDEFDALVHLVTRAIIKSRRHGRISMSTPVDDITAAAQMALDPRVNIIQTIAGLPQQEAAMEGPWTGLCGSAPPCMHYGILDNREWCRLHERVTSAIGGCNSWSTGNGYRVAG